MLLRLGVVLVVLLLPVGCAPLSSGAEPRGNTWNTWTAEAKTRSAALTAVATAATVTGTPSPVGMVTGTPLPVGMVTGTPLPVGTLVVGGLALTPGTAHCGRLCVVGLPVSECWDVCLDTSLRMLRADDGN